MIFRGTVLFSNTKSTGLGVELWRHAGEWISWSSPHTSRITRSFPRKCRMVFAGILKQRDYLCFTVVINQFVSMVITFFLSSLFFNDVSCLWMPFCRLLWEEICWIHWILTGGKKTSLSVSCNDYWGFPKYFYNLMYETIPCIIQFSIFTGCGVRKSKYTNGFSNDLHSISNDVANILTHISVYYMLRPLLDESSGFSRSSSFLVFSKKRQAGFKKCNNCSLKKSTVSSA